MSCWVMGSIWLHGVWEIGQTTFCVRVSLLRWWDVIFRGLSICPLLTISSFLGSSERCVDIRSISWHGTPGINSGDTWSHQRLLYSSGSHWRHCSESSQWRHAHKDVFGRDMMHTSEVYYALSTLALSPRTHIHIHILTAETIQQCVTQNNFSLQRWR